MLQKPWLPSHVLQPPSPPYAGGMFWKDDGGQCLEDNAENSYSETAVTDFFGLWGRGHLLQTQCTPASSPLRCLGKELALLPPTGT